MIDKLKIILEKYSSLSKQMADPNIVNNVTEYAKKELGYGNIRSSAIIFFT